MIGCCLSPTVQWFQLCHGKIKLDSDEMVIILLKQFFIFIVLAHYKNIQRVDMSLSQIYYPEFEPINILSYFLMLGA